MNVNTTRTRKGKKMAEFKTRKLEFFKRLKPLGRIHLWNNTYKTHLRNRESHLEMLLENRAGEEIWMPLDYCISTKFTNKQIADMKDRI